MKPIIALTPLYDKKLESHWMLPGYMEAVEVAGGIPIMLPMTDNRGDLSQLLSLCQGVLLTGGQDVDPARYGESPIPQCGDPCLQRDEMEGVVLSLALERDMPVLGICRGLQFMNAHLGGTLYQDIPTQLPSAVCHQMVPPYHRVQHQVALVEGTPLAQLLSVETLGVNSYHHQGVKMLAPSLVAAAHGPEGLVEAAYLPDKKFVLGVQWHPEFAFRHDPRSMALMEAFVGACQ